RGASCSSKAKRALVPPMSAISRVLWRAARDASRPDSGGPEDIERRLLLLEDGAHRQLADAAGGAGALVDAPFSLALEVQNDAAGVEQRGQIEAHARVRRSQRIHGHASWRGCRIQGARQGH